MTDDRIAEIASPFLEWTEQGYAILDKIEFARALLAAGASEGQTFEQWIADKGINPKIYTSQSNPGGAYGWAQKAWRARDAELTALRERVTGIKKDAERDVLAERQRQMDKEGWTPECDDRYINEELALAAIVYAESAVGYHPEAPDTWPWHPDWFKPTTPRRDLVKAGALILAEIERLDRAAIAKEPK